LSGQIKKSEVGHTEFWWGNFRERDQLEDLGLNWRIMKGILKECGVGHGLK